MSAPKLTASQQATIRNARRLVAAFEVARTPLEFFGYLGRSPVNDDPAGRAGEAWGYTIGHLRHVLEVVDELDAAASTVQCKETSGDGHAVCTRPVGHQGGHRDEDLSRYWPRHDDGSEDQADEHGDRR